MRIMVISTDSGATEEHKRAREALLKQAAGPDVEIRFEGQVETTVCVDSNVDVVITGPETLKRALKAQEEGYDAVCLFCGSDPAYDACRELLTIPVIGAAHAAFALAANLGFRYSFITTSKRRIPQKREFIRTCNIDINRLASVRAIEYDMEAGHERTETIKALADAAKRCAQEDGADTVILGCLSFAGMGKEISELSGVTVVDPAYAMIAMAEAVVRMGISHSKIAYPAPPAAKRNWQRGSLDTSI
ncbi:aspartate/glutamate racemase family protein [Christensenellaceae bacterium OttesenSCG-928-M15]|nr:aspartate/glutamate racemase family protein [Christensenellaceae bacterium OttesenSCG-928-M15]